MGNVICSRQKQALVRHFGMGFCSPVDLPFSHSVYVSYNRPTLGSTLDILCHSFQSILMYYSPIAAVTNNHKLSSFKVTQICWLAVLEVRCLKFLLRDWNQGLSSTSSF